MATVSVRYFVDNIDEAIDFYTGQLGFHEEMHPSPTFAMLSRGDLRLVLTVPVGGREVAKPCQTGASPPREDGTASAWR